MVPIPNNSTGNIKQKYQIALLLFPSLSLQSAVTFIEGVEDVRRGCRSDGYRCDHANNPYLEDKSILLGSLYYDVKYCVGSLCNRAQSVVSTTSIVLATLASFVVFLAL